MQGNTTVSSRPKQVRKRQAHPADSFAKVLDGRKQPIRGLWIRNGRFYARLNVEDGTTGRMITRRVSLVDKEQKPVGTVAQAVDELKRLQTKRGDGTMPVLIRTPKFADFAAKYIAGIKIGGGTKKAGTISKEESHIRLWNKHLGGVRLDKIKKSTSSTSGENGLRLVCQRGRSTST